MTYRATPRVHRFKDVLEAGLLDKILDMMTHREVSLLACSSVSATVLNAQP